MQSPYKGSVKRCYWCASASPTTRDDVFPQTLILGPKPNDWLRVPACKSCNSSLQKDEQYFRFVVLLGRNYLDPTARELWDEKMRPYLRRSPNFARRLFDSLREVEVRSPAGQVLGKGQAHPVDETRVNRVLEKIVRGLFYAEHRQPLGEAKIVWRYFQVSSAVPRELRDLITQAPVRSVGGVVKYRYVYASADPRCSFTLLRFYQSGFFVVSTVPADPLLPDSPHGTTPLEAMP